MDDRHAAEGTGKGAGKTVAATGGRQRRSGGRGGGKKSCSLKQTVVCVSAVMRSDIEELFAASGDR